MLILEKLRLILRLMDARDRRKLALISLLSIITGLLGVAGIASVLPFIGLVSNPSLMETNRFILAFKEVTGIDSRGGMIIAFGGISLFLIIFGNLVAAFESWYGELFGAQKNRELSVRLLENWLHTDALEFEKKKSAERAKEILSDVERILVDTLFSMLDLLSEFIVTLFIVVLLLWVDWAVTLVVFGVLLVVHLAIHAFTSSYMTRTGKEYTRLESSIFCRVLEALKLQKEIKLNGISRFFVDRFSESSRRMVRNQMWRSVVGEMPNRIFEVVAFGTVLLVAIYFAVFSDSDTEPVTLIGMYAFAAYRLMPSVASIFANLENIWYDSADLEGLVLSLRKPDPDSDPPGACTFRETIALSGISFSFSEHGPFHLDGLDLEFPANRMTCVKGRTGCGKSTVLYLVAGLYQPAAGSILLDGEAVDVYRSDAWKKQIGFVPAQVNLLDASLYENIALGMDYAAIDQERVREVCALVELDGHIQGLERGYDSVYGEGGLSFSSGQIQKVGIARALYRGPRLLLLDESTDAFDLETENTVLSRLTAIKGMTIIFVSHRPSVMEHADCIIDLEKRLD